MRVWYFGTMATLRALREQHGFTQAEFAQAIGLERTGYVRLERGQRRVDATTLANIGAILQLDNEALGALVRSLGASNERRAA